MEDAQEETSEDTAEETTEETTEEGTEENPDSATLYFPPTDGSTWETIALESLGWDADAEQPLYDFLEARGTDAFIILKDGKIAIERYFGDFTQDDPHAWNSTGKTLTAFMVGVAQQEGHLSLSDASSDYLGQGWSALTRQQEDSITIRHHLTMTTGLDYSTGDIFCTDPECLTFKNEPGSFWYYHNAPYTLLQDVVAGAIGQDFEDYFDNRLRTKIGMTGRWVSIGYNNNYFSDARSMARFGLLNLNQGIWDDEAILTDTAYFEEMVNSSQNLNPAYGYLWWLNGKDILRLPGSEIQINAALIPNAPDDLIAGLGKNDQKLYIVPSQGLVIVRMGDAAGDEQLGPSSFDNTLWEKINGLMGD